ncbi:hypothetical protein Gotur_029991 [Gossypium turneri]
MIRSRHESNKRDIVNAFLGRT